MKELNKAAEDLTKRIDTVSGQLPSLLAAAQEVKEMRQERDETKKMTEEQIKEIIKERKMMKSRIKEKKVYRDELDHVDMEVGEMMTIIINAGDMKEGNGIFGELKNNRAMLKRDRQKRENIAFDLRAFEEGDEEVEIFSTDEGTLRKFTIKIGKESEETRERARNHQLRHATMHPEVMAAAAETQKREIEQAKINREK